MSQFSLNKTMGSSWRVDENDVINTKTALRDIGYYKPPAHGINDWTDDAMFDGMMKPGGPTEGKINDVILAAGRREPNVGQPSVLSPQQRDRNGNPVLTVPPSGSKPERPNIIYKDGKEYRLEKGFFGLPTYVPTGNSRSKY